MASRPILRFPEPTNGTRIKRKPGFPPPPEGPDRQTQGRRFQATFDRLAEGLKQTDPGFTLRADPNGIAPERALVFVTAGSIQSFVKVARGAGLDVLAETDLEATADVPDGFALAKGARALPRTLYATIPTIEALRRLQALWRAHQKGEKAPHGASPWWSLFNLLLELRVWGPEDRLTGGAREVIEDRLPPDGDTEVSLELEIWPTVNEVQRVAWRREAEKRVADLGGRVLDRASISEDGFVYDAILAGLSASAARDMLASPGDVRGLATLEGVQFVLPQTLAQTLPDDQGSGLAINGPRTRCNGNAPVRAALLDATPAAAHPLLDQGVTVEDVNDLVRLSVVDRRFHATGMASLILRGDLLADGEPLSNTRIVSVPLLVDQERDARSPKHRLFVDLVHVSLTRLLRGTKDQSPLAARVFVANLSVGVRDSHFAGRISALARLIDWWSATEGLLFVISAGNVRELTLNGIRSRDFEDASPGERCDLVSASLREAAFDRTLLSPAESLNALSVGALSKDLSDAPPLALAGIVSLEADEEVLPQVTSALGPGPRRAIKPDLLEAGGKVEVRVLPHGANTRLRPITGSGRTGLIVAAPLVGRQTTGRMGGTSPAAALVTRAILQSAEALTSEGGPYEGQDLPRWTLALLSRALAVNSARWPEAALRLLRQTGERLHPARAKEEVSRYFGHGVLDSALMRRSPEAGVTLVGYGALRKDQSDLFSFPLPLSWSGERVPRSMRVTAAWFSPVDPVRAQYRLAGLEVLSAGKGGGSEGAEWGLDLKTFGPDANMVKRGTVWSRRLIQRIQTAPVLDENEVLQLRVQCRDTSGGGLSPDDDVPYALAVTLEAETDLQQDVYQEVRERLLLPLRAR